ncbi:MAG: hypothetical protein AAGJ87_06980 [Pseudomonadota bacterium]
MDVDHAARQLSAVWALAFSRDPEDWTGRLDRSLESVFRSFWAIAFSAPFVVMALIAWRRTAAASPQIDATALMAAPLPLQLAIESVVYLADWGVSVAAIVLFARALDVSRHAADAIIAYNWTQVFAAVFQSIPVAIAALGGATALVGVFALPAIAVSLMILWAVFRRALTLTPGMTLALIIVMILITIIVGGALREGATVLFQASL